MKQNFKKIVNKIVLSRLKSDRLVAKLPHIIKTYF